MKSCKQVLDCLSPYIDHMLEKQEEKEVADHLLSCTHCRREYEFLCGIKKQAEKMPTISVSDTLHNKIIEKCQEKKKKAVRFKRMSYLSGSIAAALVVSLSLASFYNMPGQPGTTHTPQIVAENNHKLLTDMPKENSHTYRAEQQTDYQGSKTLDVASSEPVPGQTASTEGEKTAVEVSDIMDVYPMVLSEDDIKTLFFTQQGYENALLLLKESKEVNDVYYVSQPLFDSLLALEGCLGEETLGEQSLLIYVEE